MQNNNNSFMIKDIKNFKNYTAANPIQTGRIESLRPDKGFGYVRIDISKYDLFFHINEFVEEIDFSQLKKGDKLSFYVAPNVVKGEYKARAVNIRQIKD